MDYLAFITKYPAITVELPPSAARRGSWSGIAQLEGIHRRLDVAGRVALVAAMAGPVCCCCGTDMRHHEERQWCRSPERVCDIAREVRHTVAR
eukprot:3229466-Pleurochrysis_carterae.AAC.1